MSKTIPSAAFRSTWPTKGFCVNSSFHILLLSQSQGVSNNFIEFLFNFNHVYSNTKIQPNRNKVTRFVVTKITVEYFVVTKRSRIAHEMTESVKTKGHAQRVPPTPLLAWCPTLLPHWYPFLPAAWCSPAAIRSAFPGYVSNL